MAHKQGGGSTKNNRDSRSKRLGIKKHNLNYIRKGGIILRQRGFQYLNGINVAVGKDFTLYSLIDGFVDMSKNPKLSVIPYL